MSTIWLLLLLFFARRFQRKNRDVLLGLFDRVTVADFEPSETAGTWRCFHWQMGSGVVSASCSLCGPLVRT